MPTRNINLTAEQNAFVQEVVEAGEYQNASEAMVSSGLRRGEQVVVYPGDGLTDNSRVTVR